MVKMALSEGQNLTLNFDFRVDILTFLAENTLKSGSFKAEHNAPPTSEHLQNNFDKVQKTTFLALKIIKMICSKDKNLAYNLVGGLPEWGFKYS